MRTLLLSLLLFQTSNAFSQTVGAEIDSGPLPGTHLSAFLPAPPVTMARDRTGVAIAWLMPGAMGDRISVVRLDVTGHFTGHVHSIPASSDALDVITPSIAAAPQGNGFTLAWLETSISASSVTRAAYCRLDRDLQPSSPSLLTIVPSASTGPAIVRAGKTTWISAGTSVWELRDDGSLAAPLDAGMGATDMAVATNVPQLVGLRHIFGNSSTCRPDPGCVVGGFPKFCVCLVPVAKTSALLFTSLYSVSASKTFDFDTDAAPSIGSDGRDVALVWLNGNHARGGEVVMTRVLPPSFTDFPTAANQSRVIGSFGPDIGPTRADIASDGERYVVVWRTQTTDRSHDIIGASIDRGGNIVPLSIATSTADERDPSVVSIGDGTFLVAYEKFIGGERRIAGRFVTFGSRTRVVR
jgi:hypothetical protein